MVDEVRPAKATPKAAAKPVKKRKKRSSKRKTAKKKAAKKRAPAKLAESSKGSVWTFPRDTLEDALVIARAIEDKYAGNAIAAPMLAQAVGFKKVSDWRFKNLLRSASQYGLVSGTGTTATVSLEPIGDDIVAPSGPGQRQDALLKAFHNVDQFAKVDDFYKGKKIPEDEFFENTLVRTLHIPRDRVKQFKDVYLANLKYLGAFAIIRPEESEGGREEPKPEPPTEERRPRSSRVREFLDTCFVMMPFGEWFDRYYLEIYAPAIKEAGFEPVRADELFTTGSVVEQIWEQIEKSTVLLADLTDKNPNVFYELGLAHAARKPVVFTTGNVADVPFDLRHLRVIPYEIREPEWAAELAKNVTNYLKNAKDDPEKSIPHPFRTAASDEEN